MHSLEIGLLAALTLFSLSCGTNPSAPSTAYQNACAAGVAQIGVNDGSLVRFCGCAEASGTGAQPPEPVTCTVPSGTIVLFTVTNATLKHQIIPANDNSPVIPAGPIYNPLDMNPDRVHAVQLTTPGTYAFEDGIDHALNGRIIVQ